MVELRGVGPLAEAARNLVVGALATPRIAVAAREHPRRARLDVVTIDDVPVAHVIEGDVEHDADVERMRTLDERAHLGERGRAIGRAREQRAYAEPILHRVRRAEVIERMTVLPERHVERRQQPHPGDAAVREGLQRVRLTNARHVRAVTLLVLRCEQVRERARGLRRRVPAHVRDAHLLEKERAVPSIARPEPHVGDAVVARPRDAARRAHATHGAVVADARDL